MRLEYDAAADAAYLRLSESAIVQSEEVKPGIVLDYDADQRLVGIELLGVSKQIRDFDVDRIEIDTVRKG